MLENRYSSSFEGGGTLQAQGQGVTSDNIIVSEEVITSGGGNRFDLDDEMPVSLSSIDKPFVGSQHRQLFANSNRARPMSSVMMRPNTASAKSVGK